MTSLRIILKNMSQKLTPRLSSVSIGGRPLCNFRFADDIDLHGSSEEELQQITERLEKTAVGYGMGRDLTPVTSKCRWDTPTDASAVKVAHRLLSRVGSNS